MRIIKYVIESVNNLPEIYLVAIPVLVTATVCVILILKSLPDHKHPREFVEDAASLRDIEENIFEQEYVRRKISQTEIRNKSQREVVVRKLEGYEQN